jgi:DNA-binding transcriptional MerR regulator
MAPEKSPDAFRTISEVARELDLPQHVLRFWETKFSQIKPMKRGGGRRYYRPSEIEFLQGIRHLLYVQGYTIKGAQKVISEHGVRFVTECWQDGPIEAMGGQGVAQPVDSSPDIQKPVETLDDQPVAIKSLQNDHEPVAVTHTAAVGISPDMKSALRSVLIELREARDMLRSVQQGQT